MDGRLYRSRSDKIVAGVCGGLGDYLRIDPIFVRIFFFLLLLKTGIGFWLYLILWMLIPYADTTGTYDFNQRVQTVSDDFVSAINQPNPKLGLIVGGGLVFFGTVWLIESLNIPWLWWLDFDYLWPVLLIIAGIILVYRFVVNREMD